MRSDFRGLAANDRAALKQAWRRQELHDRKDHGQYHQGLFRGKSLLDPKKPEWIGDRQQGWSDWESAASSEPGPCHVGLILTGNSRVSNRDPAAIGMGISLYSSTQPPGNRLPFSISYCSLKMSPDARPPEFRSACKADGSRHNRDPNPGASHHQ